MSWPQSFHFRSFPGCYYIQTEINCYVQVTTVNSWSCNTNPGLLVWQKPSLQTIYVSFQLCSLPAKQHVLLFSLIPLISLEETSLPIRSLQGRSIEYTPPITTGNKLFFFFSPSFCSLQILWLGKQRDGVHRSVIIAKKFFFSKTPSQMKYYFT